MLIPLSRALKFLPPLSLLFCVAQPSASAQVFGSENVLTTSADSARSVFAIDLDGDGDADILSASEADNKIAWYENQGAGVFGGQEVITNIAFGAVCVYAIDLDGDGDADVLSASQDNDMIAWYENLGAGLFGQQQVISLQAGSATSVSAADLDGDGDADILSASWQNGDKVAWYRNNGNGTFGGEQLISTSVQRVEALHTADVDSDGDIDVLAASYWDGKITWFENDGSGGFVSDHTITSSAPGALAVHAADLDGDSDVDVISAWGGVVAHYENQGGGVFGPQQIVSSVVGGANSVYVSDLDGDGDQDVLSASEHLGGVIAWYQNLGSGTFGGQQVISSNTARAQSVFAIDLNGDAFPDVISASRDDDKIAWHRNEMWWVTDCNSNGISDQVDIGVGAALDCDGNGSLDACEITSNPGLDFDGNGILDSCEAAGPYWFRSPITQRLMTVLPPSLYGSARADATVLGGTLATIRSAAENDWLHGILPGDHFWIGYNDGTVEGTFIWHSQETPGYENWAPGAPGNFTADQDFVAFRPSDGTWDTWFLNSLYRAVVESDGIDCDGDMVLDGDQIQSDPSLDMDGDGQLDACVAARYCTGAINSSGDGGSMHAIGSPVLSQNNLTLRAIDLPPLQWSYFLMSQSQASVPTFGGSQGTLCLGAPIVRFNIPGTGQVDQTTGGGTRTYLLDYQGLPQGVTFLPGATWNFQLWFRDVNPSVTSNTTDGVTVMFR